MSARRQPPTPTCGQWWELGIEQETAVTSLVCELSVGHGGPHQETVRWDVVRERNDILGEMIREVRV